MNTLINKKDQKAIDQLIEFHGGAQSISNQIKSAKNKTYREKTISKSSWVWVLDECEKIDKVYIRHNTDYPKHNSSSVATIQVSGFQGTKAILGFIKESRNKPEKTLVPAEMISVVGLTDTYVNEGDLLSALYLTENVLGVKRFCSSSLVTTPMKEGYFNTLESILGVTFDRNRISETYSSAVVVNQGTAYGNLCGIECANSNYLLYLDGVLRAAKTTGATFFLNPSWNTIVAGCYLSQKIPEITYKISCFLGLQSTIHFQLLLSILRNFKTNTGSPVVEINIGNAVNSETFCRCNNLLHADDLSNIDLAAHVRINNDLGVANYDWLREAEKVLQRGCNITLKYESAGLCSSIDTIGVYFSDDITRNLLSSELGRVLRERVIRASIDSEYLASKGYSIKHAGELS